MAFASRQLTISPWVNRKAEEPQPKDTAATEDTKVPVAPEEPAESKARGKGKLGPYE